MCAASMRYADVAAVLVIAAVAAHWLSANADVRQDLKIAISEGSIQIGDVEFRSGPYISLAAAEKALGKSEHSYQTGDSGVHVYAWRGIHLLKSRSRPAGVIFKFQVWFDDYYDKDVRKHSGKFAGHVQVDGVDIGPETTFNMVRGDLQSKGYAVGDYSGTKSANKGEIAIFTVGAASDKIQRVEVWCTH
jgi:hypothetical protein